MSEQAPKRRSFRYGLRTLFVVVTVVGCWLGWNFNQVRQRERIKARLESRGDIVIWPAGSSAGAHVENVPVTWRVFGVQPVAFILLPNSFTGQERQRVEAYFPEAVVSECPIAVTTILGTPEEFEHSANVESKAIGEVTRRESVSEDQLEAHAVEHGEGWLVTVWLIPRAGGQFYLLDISKSGNVSKFARGK